MDEKVKKSNKSYEGRSRVSEPSRREVTSINNMQSFLSNKVTSLQQNLGNQAVQRMIRSIRIPARSISPNKEGEFSHVEAEYLLKTRSRLPAFQKYRKNIQKMVARFTDHSTIIQLYPQVVHPTEEEAIRIGGEREREVPPHLDREIAAIERGGQSRIPTASTESLVRLAITKNGRLFHPPPPMGHGPLTQSAIAETLIMIYDTLDARIQAAPLGEGGIPNIEGLEWELDDPLAGLIEAIPPFNMYDLWVQFLVEGRPSRGRRRGERGRQPSTPQAIIRWYPVPQARERVSPFASITIGTQIDLDGSGSQGRSLRYEWTLNGPEGSRATIDHPDQERCHFIIDREGTYFITLEVTNPAGRGTRARVQISTGERPPPPTPREILRESLPLTAENTFARWFLTNYDHCMRINPGRCTRESWWRHGRERVYCVATFHRILGPELERLRQVVSEGTQITREVEDSFEFFSYNRRSLQQTVNSWAIGFEQASTEGEAAYGFQNEPEYIAFRQLMLRAGIPEPRNRINIPYRNNPRFP